ncbi:AAA family ATPase [Bacillus mycoides]|uniref:AAA family ATPase n=1 Tax=Bacillus mycoides TaxID=1405 RepID=UPI002112CC5D|nr:AAA family ATPase [Bacillus mycoides]MCQ6565081.1 AAA family ATPase [Bacillus mycoides]
MKFYETRFGQSLSKPGVHLVKDRWNDYGYYTLYRLFFVSNSSSLDIGLVKIGMSGEDNPSTIIPDAFEKLGDNFFSLGQRKEYYERLNKLDPRIREEILTGLNDIAYDLDLFDRVIKYEVTQNSLLRDVRSFTVRNQFHRIAKGGVPLTPYQFSYQHIQEEREPVIFNFEVEPDSMPPTNIHALIGSNGVGKTTIINDMIHSLLDSKTLQDKNNCFYDTETLETTEIFANAIFISFSAFDNTNHFRDVVDEEKGIIYSYIGLKDVEEVLLDTNSIERSERFISKNPEILIKEFLESIKRIKDTKDLWRLYKWKESISMLESDFLFKSFGIKEIELKDIEKLKATFNSLSSGHKIILLTITKLIEKVDEKSLVILDEPESHLHPPLLSAFIRALSDILISRNGVAIVATHSPVILQELPRSCVSIIKRRSKDSISIQRPDVETFGENVGTLTREVFGLEVTYSGFHKILEDLVEKGKDYDEIIDLFNGELGLEARTILRSLLLYKE